MIPSLALQACGGSGSRSRRQAFNIRRSTSNAEPVLWDILSGYFASPLCPALAPHIDQPVSL
ncbi:MAG TPA: hypothetical protein VG013_38210, partial [Gemmataceae bacterium]|nr:hypothetical protein [Gemmataceae bacterium]